MSDSRGTVSKEKNAYDTEIKKGSKKCFGCHSTPINRTCFYRNWRQEGRSAYAFRVFRKVHLLPTCSKPNFKYEEREEMKQAYCDELGVTYQELFPRDYNSRGGGGGGAKKKVYKMLT